MVLRLTDRSRIFLTFLSLIGISGGIAAGCDSEQADELTSAARQAIVSDWASGVTYQADDLVGFDGSTYRCLQGHTSQVGWEPPNVPALWVFESSGSPNALCEQDPVACCPPGMQPIQLTDQSDTATATLDNQCLLALSGDDTLQVTATGPAAIISGPGADTLHGGPDINFLVAGAGNDVLYAYDGSDALYGGSGSDNIFAGNGQNRVVPGAGLDVVSCGDGNDSIIIHDLCEIAAGEQLDGGGGIDTLVSPVPLVELEALGVVIANIENVIVENNSCQSECAALPTCSEGEICKEGVEPGSMTCVAPEVSSPYENAIAGEARALALNGSKAQRESTTHKLPLPAGFAGRVAGKTGPAGPVYGMVTGLRSDGGTRVRYKWLLAPPVVDPVAPEPKPDGTDPVPAPVITPRLAQHISAIPGTETVNVVVRLAQNFETQLAPPTNAEALVTFNASSPDSGRQQRIDARKAEATQIQQAFINWLAQQGAGAIISDSFWLVNALSLRVPANLVDTMAQNPDVEQIDLDSIVPGSSPGVWDGVSLRVPVGMNIGLYHQQGIFGAKTAPPVAGTQCYNNVGCLVTYGSSPRDVSLAVLDVGFDPSHPAFRAEGINRVSAWDCNTAPCTAACERFDCGISTDDLLASGMHGDGVAAIAAGNVDDLAISNIISGVTSADQVTGIAPRALLGFYQIGGIHGGSGGAHTVRALEEAYAAGYDVVNESRGGTDRYCDGKSGDEWETAVYEAHKAGVFVVGSAGNDRTTVTCQVNQKPFCIPPSRNCRITALAEAPSMFVVGDLVAPTGDNYSSSPMVGKSGDGGVDVTINGRTFGAAFSAVDAVVPGAYPYAAVTNIQVATDSDGNVANVSRVVGGPPGFDQFGGTSGAAPKIAGAALLFKSWALSYFDREVVETPGYVFANLLAMTDRQSDVGILNAGFDPVWGGGRFQMRMFTTDDHPSGRVGWESVAHEVGNGESVWHQVGGVGAEPSWINTFKVYMVFFEEDGEDVADLDLLVHDCSNVNNPSAVPLGSDLSRDYKSMVSIGTTARNTEVCVQVQAQHVPGGEKRLFQLVTYWTDETSMR